MSDDDRLMQILGDPMMEEVVTGVEMGIDSILTGLLTIRRESGSLAGLEAAIELARNMHRTVKEAMK